MSALAANPQLLLNLQSLVNAGHINPEEFAADLVVHHCALLLKSFLTETVALMVQ